MQSKCSQRLNGHASTKLDIQLIGCPRHYRRSVGHPLSKDLLPAAKPGTNFSTPYPDQPCQHSYNPQDVSSQNGIFRTVQHLLSSGKLRPCSSWQGQRFLMTWHSRGSDELREGVRSLGSPMGRRCFTGCVEGSDSVGWWID